ncbi:MAG: hypothetical protein ACYTXY_08465, partial [Nostoc sp.]
KIANDGWLDLIPLSFIFFQDIELPTDSNDRVVWQLTQQNQQNRVILLTANRNMKGEDSLRFNCQGTARQLIHLGRPQDALPCLRIRQQLGFLSG